MTGIHRSPVASYLHAKFEIHVFHRSWEILLTKTVHRVRVYRMCEKLKFWRRNSIHTTSQQTYNNQDKYKKPKDIKI